MMFHVFGSWLAGMSARNAARMSAMVSTRSINNAKIMQALPFCTSGEPQKPDLESFIVTKKPTAQADVAKEVPRTDLPDFVALRERILLSRENMAKVRRGQPDEDDDSLYWSPDNLDKPVKYSASLASKYTSFYSLIPVYNPDIPRRTSNLVRAICVVAFTIYFFYLRENASDLDEALSRSQDDIRPELEMDEVYLTIKDMKKMDLPTDYLEKRLDELLDKYKHRRPEDRSPSFPLKPFGQ